MVDIAALRAASDFPVFKPTGAGLLGCAYGTITIATNPTAADIYSVCKIPPCTVVGGLVYGDDLDTNATETLDFDVGWAANGVEAADPDGFGNFGVVTGDAVVEYKPVAGILLPFQGTLLTAGPQTFSAETTIIITFNAAAATGGTGQLSANVYYVVP